MVDAVIKKKKPVNILMIEDNEGDIELIKIAFEEVSPDCNLYFINNGQEGLDYLQKKGQYEEASTPDIILLDINMPGLSGIEVLKFIKTNKKLRTIPVIMLTSSGAQKDISECLLAHANTYLVKPASFDKFIELAQNIYNYWVLLTKLPSE